MNHFHTASGMTDKMAALSLLACMDGDGLVINKWFVVQAAADLPDVLDRVQKLMEHHLNVSFSGVGMETSVDN
jgi:aminopeptidase N